MMIIPIFVNYNDVIISKCMQGVLTMDPLEDYLVMIKDDGEAATQGKKIKVKEVSHMD